MRGAALVPTVGALLASSPAYAQVDGQQLPQTVRELVRAERSFARYSIEHGVRPAFLHFLADDGIIFRPRPTNGKEWYAGRPNPAGTLDWAPAYAAVSAAADMGWTTGPWSFTSTADSSVAYGHYVSVWRVQQDGAWRVAIDGGIVHGPTDPAPDETELGGFAGGSEPEGGYADSQLERERLLAADRELANSVSRDGPASGFEAVAAPNLRLYRMGQPPTVGRLKAIRALDGEPQTLTWEPMSGAVSASHDLGYTFGIAVTGRDDQGQQRSASYMRIWSREAGGEWRLELDLLIPIPPIEPGD